MNLYEEHKRFFTLYNTKEKPSKSAKAKLPHSPGSPSHTETSILTPSHRILCRFVSSFHQVTGSKQCPTRFVAPGVEAGREHHAAPLRHRSLHPGQVGGQKQSRPKEVKYVKE